MRPPWNQDSHVACLANCDGRSCNHFTECAVCGYDLPVSGYDCFACDTAAVMFPATLKEWDADKFIAAMKVAVGLAIDEAERLAA